MVSIDFITTHLTIIMICFHIIISLVSLCSQTLAFVRVKTMPILVIALLPIPITIPGTENVFAICVN